MPDNDNYMKTIESRTAHCNRDDLALHDTIYAIGGKWKMRIFKSLCLGNIRFTEIEKSLTGITKRTLSKELKELEINQLITRKAYPDQPSKAEYKLTSYAKTLIPMINEMVRWGTEHRQIIIKRQKTA
jgi:DNA-binding HxlR family transcriptional regulator